MNGANLIFEGYVKILNYVKFRDSNEQSIYSLMLNNFTSSEIFQYTLLDLELAKFETKVSVIPMDPLNLTLLVIVAQ